VGFTLAMLPIWLWRQGYIAAHGSNFFTEGGDPTHVRFRDQAVADKFTADGRQIHQDLEKMNTLLRTAPTDLKLRIRQMDATITAINQYEKSVEQARTDVQSALEGKQYASRRDRRKLEDLLKIFDIRKKVADVHLRLAGRIISANGASWTMDARGMYFQGALQEYIDDMNSDIRYLNQQAAEIIKHMGEQAKPEAPAPPVLEVGSFSEAYGVAAAPPPDKVGSRPSYTKENPLILSHGFLLTSDGIAVIRLGSLLTQTPLQVRLADGRLYTVNSILSYDVDHDLAMVRLGRPFAEPANWPDELPSLALEVEGVPRPSGAIGIQTKKERLNADAPVNAGIDAGMFTVIFTEPPGGEPLTMRACGLPVVNSEGQVIGVLCGKSPYSPKMTRLPQIPLPAPGVSSSVLRTMFAQNQGLQPNDFFYYMKKNNPDAIPNEIPKL
jgi:hypothetical protein